MNKTLVKYAAGCIVMACGIGAALAQPIADPYGGDQIDLSQHPNAIDHPVFDQIPSGIAPHEGRATWPEGVVCNPSAYGWTNGLPFTKISPEGYLSERSQLIDCFYYQYSGTYQDYIAYYTKDWRDYRCDSGMATGDTCSYFGEWWWIDCTFDRVAGFTNSISPPPGSASLQHYSDVGAVAEVMTVRASVGANINTTDLTHLNMRWRLTGYDGVYSEVPVSFQDVITVPSTYPGANPGSTMRILDTSVVEWQLPTSAFLCSHLDKTKAALNISLYCDLYDPDTQDYSEFNLSVTYLDWIVVEWEEVAPVMLVHGISQSASYWDVTDFHGFGHSSNPPFIGLSKWIPPGLIENGISLVNDPNGRGTIVDNAAELERSLIDSAEFYGVDRVHIVAHSKGGLDTREYLRNSDLYKPEELRVISFHTMSTPHEGSVLADVRSSVQDALLHKASYLIPLSERLATEWKTSRQPGPGYRDLTTWHCRKLRSQINELPKDCVYTTYGADADVNGNGVIDDCTNIFTCDDDELGVALDLSPDWYGELELDLFATFAYNKLATTRTWNYDITVKEDGTSNHHGWPYPVIHPNIIPTHVHQRNDLMVTERSAWGYGDSIDGVFSDGFSRLSGEGNTLDPWSILVNPAELPILGNHAEVTSTTVGEYSHVGPAIISADKRYGFLEEASE